MVVPNKQPKPCDPQGRAGRTPPPREARNTPLTRRDLRHLPGAGPLQSLPTHSQQFSPLLYPIRPVAHPPEAATRLGRQGRRFCESRYSLSAYSCYPSSSSAPVESATSFVELQSSVCRCVGLRDPKGRKSSAPIQPQAQPNSPPRIRLTAAPLSLRHFIFRALTEILFKRAPRVRMISFSSSRARGFSSVARWDFISILLTAKRVKSLFTRADDCRALSRLELPSGRAGPTSRGRENAYAFSLICLVQFFSRALGRFILFRLFTETVESPP
mgnify:CR=1 FL=1